MKPLFASILYNHLYIVSSLIGFLDNSPHISVYRHIHITLDWTLSLIWETIQFVYIDPLHFSRPCRVNDTDRDSWKECFYMLGSRLLSILHTDLYIQGVLRLKAYLHFYHDMASPGHTHFILNFQTKWKWLPSDISVVFEFAFVRCHYQMVIVTVRNVVAERLCFHRRLPFCSHGGCVPACTGADTPREDTPRQTPPPTATAADGTHPTGMHSCYIIVKTC